jgi:hypothetical protein
MQRGRSAFSRSLLLYRAGQIILIVGLVAALIIYAIAPSADLSATPDDQRYVDQVERIGGKLQLAMIQFQHWFASLWHGSSLAFTLATLSIVAALICFWLSDLLESDETLPPQD